MNNKPPKESLYETVIKNNYSVRSGAYAVIDDRITMRLNEYGEYYPYTDDINAFNNPLLAKVCAMSPESPNEDDISKELFADIQGIKYNSILGYYSDLYAGYVSEGKYRENASSGGMATWILKELLGNKLIDGVIHVRESSDEVLFKYDISETVEEICQRAKTRYYPVEFSHSINAIKSTKGRYAIVGIPSVIMEVRLLSKQDQEINDRIKYTIGLICGHQKSTKYAENLAWQSGIRPGNLKSINFRKKIANKPSSTYATEMTGVIDGQNTTVTVNQDEMMGTNWGHGFFKSKFSDFTDDAMNETADISLGDAWLPEYTRDPLGTNVAIVRNTEIAQILKTGIESGALKLDTLSEARMIKSQSGLIHHTRDELPYRLSKEDRRGLWRPIKRLEASDELPALRKYVQNLRESISTRSHETYKKAVELNDWTYFQKQMRLYVWQYRLTYIAIRLSTKKPSWIVKKIISKLKQTT